MSDAESVFLRNCRGEQTETTPVWFMRQAGRSLPEYRVLRGDRSILEAIKNPELAAEITMQPIRRYGVDAAILFCDIVVPIAAIGIDLDIVAGRGPVIDQPFRSKADLSRLRALEPDEDLPFVIETVRELSKDLRVPLIGFAGAPFTVASYLVEGGSTKTFARTKALMHSDPSFWFALIDRLADITISFLRAQVGAGVKAIQIFDSWAGALSRSDYEHFVLPGSAKVFAGLSDLRVPRIHFGVGTGEILDLMAKAGADVVGVDWRVPLDRAQRRVGDRALQGNLDPAICLADFSVVKKEAQKILDQASTSPGHIFNLGHGVLPETNPDTLARLVEYIHEVPRITLGTTK